MASAGAGGGLMAGRRRSGSRCAYLGFPTARCCYSRIARGGNAVGCALELQWQQRSRAEGASGESCEVYELMAMRERGEEGVGSIIGIRQAQKRNSELSRNRNQISDSERKAMHREEMSSSTFGNLIRRWGGEETR